MSPPSPAPRPARIAIVGCGAITQIHYLPALRALAKAGRLEVSALVDPSPASLAVLQAAFPQAATAADLGDAPPPGDAAIVATPASVHAAQVTRLLGQGLHVLCEKPMAARASECDAMIAAAAAADRVLAVGLFRRQFPATAQMRELIAAGALGAVRAFEIVEGNRFQWRAKTDSFFRRSAGGGGVLLDIGVHALDLMLWWFGEPESFDYEDDAMGGVEANCRLRCRFPGGFEGTVRLSRDWNLRNRYLVHFERGWAAWVPSDPQGLEFGFSGAHALAARVHQAGRWRGQPAVGPLGANYYEGFMAQIENFVAAAQGCSPADVPGAEGARSVRLIEACYRKARLLTMPWMTPDEVRAAEATR